MGRLLFLGLCVVLASASLHAVEPDSGSHDGRSTSFVHFTIKKQKGEYRMEATVDESVVYLSERAAQASLFRVDDRDIAPIDNARIYLNGKKLKSRHVYGSPPPPQDAFLSDDRVVYFWAGSDLEVGDSVHYTYTQRWDNLAYVPMLHIPNADYMGSFTAEFEHPPEVQVGFEVCYLRDSFPVEIDTSDSRITRLHVDSLMFLEDLPRVGFNYHRAVILPIIRADGELLNPAPVPDFVAWYDANNPSNVPFADTLDPILQAELDSALTPREKLRVINDWVRRNIRYLIDDRQTHGIFPHQAEMVASRQYGDCKDRAGLTVSLARRSGVTGVSMATVSTRPQPPLENVHIEQFNHVLCTWRDGDSILFFDPTATSFEFGSLPQSLIGKQSVILDPSHPERVTVAQTGVDPQLTVLITAHPDSLAQATARLTFRRDLLALARKELDNYATTSHFDSVKALLNDLLPNMKVDNLSLIDSSYTEMHLAATVDLSRFVVSSPTRQYFPHVAFNVISNEVLVRADDALPIVYDYWYDFELRIHLSQADLTAPADSVAFGATTTGYFRHSITPNDAGGADLDYRLMRRQSSFVGEAKAAHLDFIRAYLAEKANMFALRREQLK